MKYMSVKTWEKVTKLKTSVIDHNLHSSNLSKKAVKKLQYIKGKTTTTFLFTFHYSYTTAQSNQYGNQQYYFNLTDIHEWQH